MTATKRDIQRLQGVYPHLRELVFSILSKLPMFVVMGLRTDEQQAKLYAEGRTAPGHIVTNLDGTIKRSNHQLFPDGYGHAVDMAWDVGANGLNDPFDQNHPWDQYGALVKAGGATWGGDWARLVDRPHAEWPYTPSEQEHIP